MSTFNAGFPRMTGRAKALQIARLKTQFGMCADRLDMINFKPPTRATRHTCEPVTAQDQRAQVAPPLGFRDRCRMARVFDQAHVARAPLTLGAVDMRTPCATAITVAAAASIRPVERPRTSL